MRADIHRLKAPKDARGTRAGRVRFAVVVQSDDLPLSRWVIAPTSPGRRRAPFRPGIEVDGVETRIMLEQRPELTLSPGCCQLVATFAGAVNLRQLGITVSTGPDWIEIQPGLPQPAQIETHGDHRIVMSFAVAALRTPGIGYDDPGCVRQPSPGFHQAFAALQAG